MEKYIVKPEDLKGEIAKFPIQVVQKMVDYQVEQGNKADVAIFQLYNQMMHKGGGFNWNKTKEGNQFWANVIVNENFDLFFQRFPKEIEKIKIRQNALYKHFVYLLTAVADTDMSIEIKEKKGSIIVRAVKKKEEDLPIDTPVMVSDDGLNWGLRYYATIGMFYNDGYKSNSAHTSTTCKYIIPFDKFNPNNIGESLKYNIVK